MKMEHKQKVALDVQIKSLLKKEKAALKGIKDNPMYCDVYTDELKAAYYARIALSEILAQDDTDMLYAEISTAAQKLLIGRASSEVRLVLSHLIEAYKTIGSKCSFPQIGDSVIGEVYSYLVFSMVTGK